MSNDATIPSTDMEVEDTHPISHKPTSADKGKNKAVQDVSMEEDDDDDDDEEEDGEEEDDDDMEEHEDFSSVDPNAILPTGRRTRGVRVDYTSEEALKKAGLTQKDLVEGDDDD